MADPPHADPPCEATGGAGGVSIAAVADHLAGLQARICTALEAFEPAARFGGDERERPGGGVSRPRVLSDGDVLERAAVNFTHTFGREMPPAATLRRPGLAGRSYQAVSISLIVHPRNPYAPTSHANFRCFVSPGGEAGASPIWWFGGGFDLTPYYGFEEDARHWHRCARSACAGHDPAWYTRFKRECDEYFFLPHRNEPRGIGGIFFDDLDEGGFERCFAFVCDAGAAFLDAYVPILERRKDTPWGERERAFQRLRRGRYVEFNLLYDRGTRFGLQAGAPAESVLASLPPEVSWRYEWVPEPGSREEALYRDFLVPRDWLADD